MLKVLIVEDDKFIAAIISFFVKDLGHHLVARCQSGTQALDTCKTEKPDVVLMDIHLEGELDGIQTAEKMQRDFEIPVIFISSDTSTSIVERAIIANSYGYLVKPVQKKELGISIDLAYYKHKVDCSQKRREKSFRQFMSEAAVPVIILQKGRIQYLNMNALDLFHTHYIEDMIGLSLEKFIDPEYRDNLENFLNNKLEPGDSTNRFETKVIGLHGKPLDVAVNKSHVQFNGREAVQIILTDLTNEKVAIKSYYQLRTMIIESNFPVVTVNDNFDIIEANKPFNDLMTVKQDIRGKSLNNLTDYFTTDITKLEKFFVNGSDEKMAIDFKQGNRVYHFELLLTGSKELNNLEAIIKLKN